MLLTLSPTLEPKARYARYFSCVDMVRHCIQALPEQILRDTRIERRRQVGIKAHGGFMLVNLEPVIQPEQNQTRSFAAFQGMRDNMMHLFEMFIRL